MFPGNWIALVGVVWERGSRGCVDGMLTYVTDFWGPVSNFGIPLAAIMDTQKSPDLYVPLPPPFPSPPLPNEPPG